MGFGDFLSGVGNAISSFCSKISDACERIGGSIGSFAEKVFSPVLFPTITLLEAAVKVIGAVVGAIADLFGIKEVDETPEEIGMKAEEAANQGIKPDNFDSYEEYITYLRDNIEIDKNKAENLSDEEKLKYTAIGASVLVKGIEEKEKIEIPAEFIAEIGKQKLEAEEVREYIKSFKEMGIPLSSFTGYLKGTLNANDYEKVGNAIECGIRNLNPELSIEQVDDKIDDMSKKSRGENR